MTPGPMGNEIQEIIKLLNGPACCIIVTDEHGQSYFALNFRAAALLLDAGPYPGVG